MERGADRTGRGNHAVDRHRGGDGLGNHAARRDVLCMGIRIGDGGVIESSTGGEDRWGRGMGMVGEKLTKIISIVEMCFMS